jgi:hypothetical protein
MAFYCMQPKMLPDTNYSTQVVKSCGFRFRVKQAHDKPLTPWDIRFRCLAYMYRKLSMLCASAYNILEKRVDAFIKDYALEYICVLAWGFNLLIFFGTLFVVFILFLSTNPFPPNMLSDPYIF